jgi:hypothetical protein
MWTSVRKASELVKRALEEKRADSAGGRRARAAAGPALGPLPWRGPASYCRAKGRSSVAGAGCRGMMSALNLTSSRRATRRPMRCIGVSMKR